jgi:hypothetical protein
MHEILLIQLYLFMQITGFFILGLYEYPNSEKPTPHQLSSTGAEEINRRFFQHVLLVRLSPSILHSQEITVIRGMTGKR